MISLAARWLDYAGYNARHVLCDTTSDEGDAREMTGSCSREVLQLQHPLACSKQQTLLHPPEALVCCNSSYTILLIVQKGRQSDPFNTGPPLPAGEPDEARKRLDIPISIMDQASLRPLHVVIVGAGLGGLVLAQSLRKKGLSFEIFEQDSHAESRGQGFAIGLTKSVSFFPFFLLSVLTSTAGPSYTLHRCFYCV